MELYNPVDFASEYAATKPGEDFAETFALYARSKGDVSRYFHLPEVFSKLCFINKLAGNLNKTA